MTLPLNDYGYLRSVLPRYAVDRRVFGFPSAYLRALVQSWAGQNLLQISESGSWAKGTAISGATDLDLFVSLHPGTDGTLAEIYNSLLRFLQPQVHPRRQDVSIGVTIQAAKIDLVPGRKQPGPTTDHSLYSNRRRSWLQTNVNTHIANVKNSRRIDEIRLLKVWRWRLGLDLPSFLLELVTIRALAGARVGTLAPNLVSVLDFLRHEFPRAILIDPANSNNVVSDDLTAPQKSRIANAAGRALAQSSWDTVVG